MSLRKLLARAAIALACLGAAFAFAGNTLSQRSPFTQGHWWNPARSGSGLDIFNAADQVMVIWYTFDESGHPTWYTAQGNVATLDKGVAWPLQQHRWTDGHKGDPVTVGTITLAVRNPEAMDLQWTVNGHTGTWPIVPFVASGTQIEVDHSGSWFDPSHPGWGLTVTQQGDVLGGILYAYDAQGAPTWLAGFDRGRSDSAVQLFACTGSCPWCTYNATQTKSAGQLGLEFRSETDATLHPQLALTLPAGLAIDGARIAPLSRPASIRAADRQLASFDDAASLKAFLDQAMLNLPAGQGSAGTDFSAAPPGSALSYSTTNLQEQGVDEADLVKTDGSRIFTFAADGFGNRVAAVRMASVQQVPFSVSAVGQVALAGTNVATAGLYLGNNQLVALYGSVAQALCWCNATDWRSGSTYLDFFDVSGPLPSAGWRARIDGHLVSSRRIGDRLYVVTRFVPSVPGVTPGATTTAQLEANRQALATASLDQMLPHVWVNGQAAALVGPSSVYVPPLGDRGPVADFVIVTAIDLANARVAGSMAILGGVEAVYASSTKLVLATSRYPLRSPNGTALSEPPAVVTDVHELALDATGMGIIGSATVEGYLGSNADQAPFRMSESGGRLRIVTSSGTLWNLTQNRLAVLEPSTAAPGLLRTVSVLPNAAHPEPLGKSNEFLYATRFVDDRLYAVTFPQRNSFPPPNGGTPPVDPLFVVDLSNVADPRIVGELEVPGFSEYLHPLPNGLMLGFGRFVDTSGANRGLQLSLYDVRDAGKPVEKQRVILGDTGSDSALLRDHHAMAALLNADGTGSLAFPVRIVDQGWQYSGMARFDLRGTSAADMQLVSRPSLAAISPFGSAYTGADPAVNGRALLNGANGIFVGNGRLWWQDTGGTAFGPQ